eukprot:2228765-Pyramimonas_sp.AAC.1
MALWIAISFACYLGPHRAIQVEGSARGELRSRMPGLGPSSSRRCRRLSWQDRSLRGISASGPGCAPGPPPGGAEAGRLARRGAVVVQPRGAQGGLRAG